MSKETKPIVDQQLVEAWQRTLPTTINESDKVEVKADGADPNTLRIHFITAGHSMYTFDFTCTYVDSREVKVQMVDVEKDNRSVDEHDETIQHMAEDYIRHIHECAQALHEFTHA